MPPQMQHPCTSCDDPLTPFFLLIVFAGYALVLYLIHRDAGGGK